jgi:hypothetical protein
MKPAVFFTAAKLWWPKKLPGQHNDPSQRVDKRNSVPLLAALPGRRLSVTDLTRVIIFVLVIVFAVIAVVSLRHVLLSEGFVLHPHLLLPEHFFHVHVSYCLGKKKNKYRTNRI